MEDQVNDIILDPAYHELFSIVKGFRNGIVYGTKIRFPHALVMTFLFRSGSLKDKLKAIFVATKTHARNLAFFVTIYKSMVLAQKYMLTGGKQQDWQTFIAGFVGGYIVFGENNNVNNQIILYLFSRVATGLARLVVKQYDIKTPSNAFAIFAALCWGLVMVMFKKDRSVLQSSLQASMQYLYQDSNRWSSLRTLLWHNK
ncbi:hypothetical protein H4219_000409 [Mycoemilia scoparia]|uniref:Peroxisomal membrane protein 4 n=1 Tax=Mycoemilia scoparia TaxID=417184 RepID=A0A9W8A2S0_9FUNG|nr:hypothetical protein H4219_000409 [Mycoemilia scoparia]